MKRIIVLLLVTVWCSTFVYAKATAVSDSVLTIRKDSVFRIQPASADELVYEEVPFEDGIIPATVTDSVQRYIDLAQTLIDKVDAAQNFISNIDANSRFELPVGITKTIGGISYKLVIHAVRIKPTHSELDVFLQFTIPQNNRKLTFMARGIKLTKKSGLVGDAKLELLGDNAINFNGDKIQLILKGGTAAGGSGTYAIIDCDGFREVSVDAEVKFSRDLVVPENADGKIVAGNVYAGFKATLTDWNDMLIQLDMPAFQVASLKDFGFKASDVVFDFSDTRNAPAVVFPEGYTNTSTLPGNENLWRGFYMRELLVRIPPQFQKKGGAGTELRAQNMLIDNRGVSGLFSATNIIPINEGNMNGWAFSLDSVAVKLMANELQQAGFGGQIIIPVSKETTPFNYSAFISADNDYLFTVAPTENLEFDVWQAHVDIYEGSSLEIRIVDNKFLPKAILHGRMSISAKLGDENGKGVELADIQFEDLQLQAVKPYLKVGNFSFGSEAAQQKMAQFPISIQNIGLRSLSDTETALDFNLLLNLVGEDNGAFAADAGLSLIANIGTTENGNQKWKLKDIEVRSIKIDIDGGAFKFNGSLAFYKKDIVYGNGFNGQINAEFTPGLKVKCTAIFGNVDGMRYWYADAMVNFNTGIPIFTGVGIYGFGGGAYFAMKMDNQGLGSDLGRTVSGVVYVPDTKAGLGIKAVVSIGSHPKPEAFNGDVTFEIAFFRGGGVRRIALSGNAFLVTPGLELNLDKLKQATNKMVAAVKKIDGAVSSATGGLLAGENGSTNSMDEIFGSLSAAGDKGQISAHASIEYDFENRVLHGNFEAFVNVAGGIVKGVGAGGRAGWSVLHFAPKEWYVYVGTPDDRIGLSVGIGSIRATATSYMMVGTKILDSPPPPAKVSKILGGEDLDYMSDLNAIGEGGGFAFGASFEVSTGNLNFLMFYARFEAGAGFDIMLKDYGDTRCKGSNSRIGINGWYANGQAYAYFEGEVGIRVRVFGRTKKIEILSIGAAAVLQAKLPNPFWMRGVVGGHFSVLGGLVSGNCKFRVTLGKECEIVQDADAILDDIKVIAELTPANDEMDVDVFTTPQALFNIPVEQVFELVDEVNGNIKRSFRVKLDHVKLIADKKELESSYKWNVKNDVLAVKSFEILPPKSEVTVSVQVSFEELKNGQWAGVQVNGVRTVEKLEQKFKTGEAPTYIPHRNVEYSYPAIGQVNLYKDESRNGYIKLVQGQSYLFKDDSQWKREGRFIGVSGDKAVVDFTYTETAKQVNFEIPTILKTDQVYTLELFNVPVATGGAIDRNVTQVSNKVTVGGETLDTEIASKKAEGTIEELQEQTVYAALLRSSSYATFSQKVSSFQYSMGWTWQLQVGVRELGTTLTGNECFDKYEIENDLPEHNLVRFEADLSNNSWYQLVYPITYQDYPILGKATVNRSIEPLGFPPTKAVFMRQLSEPPLLTTGNSTSIKSLFSAQRAIVYNLSLEMYRDFTTIRAKCADLSLTNNSDLIHRILYATFPSLREGDYKVKIGYYLPGSNQVNSEQSKVISYSRN